MHKRICTLLLSGVAVASLVGCSATNITSILGNQAKAQTSAQSSVQEETWILNNINQYKNTRVYGTITIEKTDDGIKETSYNLSLSIRFSISSAKQHSFISILLSNLASCEYFSSV